MFSEIAGRLLTSPLAFLFAGLLEFLLYAGATIGRWVCSLTDRMFELPSKIARR